jgi:thiamine-monophosphate kinase
MDERARIAMLARILSVPAPGVETAIGDDAAVLDSPQHGQRIVWTIDEQVEGSHFRDDWVSFRDVGWRSFMAAASDIAAMGATPWCALSALVLPDAVDDTALEQIVLGQRDAAKEVGAPVVGGNLARGPALSIATTLLGTCARAVTRRGARPGDALWLAGRVGWAAAGLRALQEGKAQRPELQFAVAAWRRPTALIAAGRAMAPLAHAAVDVSDGLARDVGHIAAASSVKVVFEEAALTNDAVLVEAAAALGCSALDLALYGGEDYALVVASEAPIEGFRRIGEVCEGHGGAVRGPRGVRSLDAGGFDHFAGSVLQASLT